jgi:hypothetical protein
MSQRTDNVNVSLFFTHFYLVLGIMSKSVAAVEKGKEETQKKYKKAEVAMKPIASEVIRSIDKVGSWRGRRRKT